MRGVGLAGVGVLCWERGMVADERACVRVRVCDEAITQPQTQPTPASFPSSCMHALLAGYAAVNRLGALRSDHDIFLTFEGDNTVLLQQVCGGSGHVCCLQRKAATTP